MLLSSIHRPKWAASDIFGLKRGFPKHLTVLYAYAMVDGCVEVSGHGRMDRKEFWRFLEGQLRAIKSGTTLRVVMGNFIGWITGLFFWVNPDTGQTWQFGLTNLRINASVKIFPRIGLASFTLVGTGSQVRRLHVVAADNYSAVGAPLTRSLSDVVARSEFVLNEAVNYDIPFPVSYAQAGAWILRRRCMTPEQSIPRGTKGLDHVGMLALHGGRIWWCGKKQRLPTINIYDLHNAYGWSASNLPPLCGASFSAQEWEPGSDTVGIYCVKGKWGTNFRNFLWGNSHVSMDADETIMVTSYELQAAHDRGMLHGLHRPPMGYAVVPGVSSPFVPFVELCSAKRVLSNDLFQKAWYKGLMVSTCYGKWASIRYDMERQKYIAGVYFHPFLAALVTGQVRARMWQAEEQPTAYMTLTDMIVTTATMPTTPVTGGWRHEYTGWAYLYNIGRMRTGCREWKQGVIG